MSHRYVDFVYTAEGYISYIINQFSSTSCMLSGLKLKLQIAVDETSATNGSDFKACNNITNIR
jgi:hypothetical protein